MRNHRLSICGAAFMIGVASMALSMDGSRADGAASYLTLLMRLHQRDLTVDFTALRHAYAQTAGYRPYDPGVTAQHREMNRDFDHGDRVDAMRIAKQILARDYVNIDAHWILGHDDGSGADFHRAVADGLTRSILNSGDGKSPRSAYRVLSIDEEYALLGRLGLLADAQSLVEHDGHHYDLLLVSYASEKPFGIYFNVDLPFAQEAGGNRE